MQKGDTLWHIAQTYSLDHKDIVRWNGAKGQKLTVGSKLVLYVPLVKAEAKVDSKAVAKAAAASPGVNTRRWPRPRLSSRPWPRPVATARGPVYTVQKGDNLSAIARRFKVTPTSLRRWNNLSDDSLSIGDKLTVKAGGNS